MKDNINENWKKFLKEGETSDLGHTVVGDFIVDHDGVENALKYLDAMRQEIEELMDEEDAEVKFTQDNPQFNPKFVPSQAVEQTVNFYQTPDGRMKWRMARNDFVAMACGDGDPAVLEQFYEGWANGDFKYVLSEMGEEVPSCED